MKKKILLFLILLGIASCGTRLKTKNTTAQKQNVQTEKTHQSESQKEENNFEKAEVSNAENSIVQIDFEKNRQSILQNFTLKNNGKCIENSAIRFVSITDNRGNKTEIPVNDNTELHYSHQNDIQTENKALKAENERLKKEKSEIETTVTALQKEMYIEQQKQEKIQKTSDLKVKSHRPTFWLFILIAVVAVIAWELIKINLKKLYNYVSIWKKKS